MFTIKYKVPALFTLRSNFSSGNFHDLKSTSSRVSCHVNKAKKQNWLHQNCTLQNNNTKSERQINEKQGVKKS